MLNEVIIVIPTYKNFNELSVDEKKSLDQCYDILKNYQICFIHPNNLEIDNYIKDSKSNLKYELLNKPFSNKYFSDISGYNNLMLNIDFYTCFIDYKYILIYQLDCWVFRDDLLYWCKLDYDYIGAPMFNNFGTHETGNELDAVGNGGFSLRKISKFIEVLSWKRNVNDFRYYLKIFKKSRNAKNLIQLLLGIFGYHNRVKYLLKFYKKQLVNEDIFFSYNFGPGSNIQIKVPDIYLSVDFAFDRSPQYLYKLNDNKLPFGCHGWNREDNIYSTKDKIFWEQFINI